MELLIIIALAVWGGARYSANGAIAHARKTEPLRIAERRQRLAQTHERRMAHVTRRSQRTTPTIVEALSIRIAERVANPRGGPAREAIALWWADSWGYATERRRLRHERAANGQLNRQKAARAMRDWVGKKWQERGTKRDATATQTSPADDPVHATATVSSPVPEDQDIVDAELVDDEPGRVAETAAGGPTAAPNQETGRTAAAPTHEQPPHPATSTAGGAEKCSATPHPNGQHQTGDDLASVHPIRKDSPTMTTTTNVTSAEIFDPSAAVAFASSAGESVAQIMTAVETSINSAGQRGVAGEPIQKLSEAYELLGGAVSAFAAAASAFGQHLATQDQLLADASLAGTVRDTYIGSRA